MTAACQRGLPFVVSVVWALVSSGATVTVDADGGVQYLSIQAGIDAASDGDTVLVADGVYAGDGNRDLDFSHGLPRGQTRTITVRSKNGPDACIIDCQGTEDSPHRGFLFWSNEGPDAVVEGFTITGGYIIGREGAWQESGGGGGAILIQVGSPTIRNNVLTGNTVVRAAGGGICCSIGEPVIEGNVIEENNALYGGGIYCYERGTITRNTIIRNDADRGGGISYGQIIEPK